MEKRILDELKIKLEEEKERVEKELNSFAKKGKGDDWDAKVPDFGEREASFDEEADQYEEYDKLLEIERALEEKLSAINLALKKIKNGKYGICESCGKEIDIRRLRANPHARACANKVCQSKFLQ